LKKRLAASVLAATVLAGCSAPAAPEASTSTVTRTPVTTAGQTPAPAPAPVKTTGDYGADLAAAGIVPDNVEDYRKFMVDFLCRSPISSFSEEVREMGVPGGESTGRSPAVVRLTVAYFCPERAAEAEKQLRHHGYVK
jgi:hypothetical protein